MSTPKESSTKERIQAAKVVFQRIVRHKEHRWEQVGRCVWCDDCSQRLYQGTIPPEHTNVKRRDYSRTPRATREMRERWGMD